MWIPNIVETTTTGITSDIYVTTSLDLRRFKRIILMIGNTGNQSLTVIIVSKLVKNGTFINTEIPATILTAGSTLTYLNDRLLAEVDLLIKSTTPGQSTQYRLEYIQEISP
jgi:hypothetical protein